MVESWSKILLIFQPNLTKFLFILFFRSHRVDVRSFGAETISKIIENSETPFTITFSKDVMRSEPEPSSTTEPEFELCCRITTLYRLALCLFYSYFITGLVFLAIGKFCNDKSFSDWKRVEQIAKGGTIFRKTLCVVENFLNS